MNDTILQLNRLAETWSDVMWRASWQGGLALLLVWGVCRALKNIPAAAKVWLWRLAWLKFIVALASPTFLDVPLLKTREARNVERGTRNEFVPSQESTTEVFAATVPVVIRPSVKGCLFLIWIVGVSGLAFWLTVQWRGTLRLRRRSRPLIGADADAMCRELARTLGIRKLPALLESEEITAPVLVPNAIIFPARHTLTAEQLRMALSHELAHCKRRDLTWSWLPTICEGLFFFHPFLWLTRREWLLQQELATDELALRTGSVAPAAYANMLLEFVAPQGTRAAFGILGISESGKTLKRRLLAMKTIGTKMRKIGVLLTAAVLIAASAAILPWRIVAQEKPADPESEIKRLQRENAELRNELSKLKSVQKSASPKESDARDTSAKITHLEVDRLRSELLNLELNKQLMLQQYTQTHPAVKSLNEQIQKLSGRLAELTSDQKSIYREEVALAEKQLAEVKRRMQAGRATQDEVLRTQREVFQLKREAAGVESNSEEIRGLIREEIGLVETLLQECRKRIQIGIESREADIPLQRELLRLKRELLSVEERGKRQ